MGQGTPAGCREAAGSFVSLPASCFLPCGPERMPSEAEGTCRQPASTMDSAHQPQAQGALGKPPRGSQGQGVPGPPHCRMFGPAEEAGRSRASAATRGLRRATRTGRLPGRPPGRRSPRSPRLCRQPCHFCVTAPCPAREADGPEAAVSSQLPPPRPPLSRWALLAASRELCWPSCCCSAPDQRRATAPGGAVGEDPAPCPGCCAGPCSPGAPGPSQAGTVLGGLGVFESMRPRR